MTLDGVAPERFRQTYGTLPTGLVRAPGRVNLIGEHIDYCGLSVLPMALDRAVWMTFRARDDDQVRVATIEPGYEPVQFAARSPIEPGPPGHWGNYLRAGVSTLLSAGNGDGLASGIGFDALVATDLPLASGLSSSSALVVATAVAAIGAGNGGELDLTDTAVRLDLAGRLAAGERYVGTAGGGMDQAACLLGVAGCALRIDFGPLSATSIQIPTDWALVVAHSGERAEKSGSAQRVYNTRTEEALGAVRVAWRVLGAEDRDGAGLESYRALLKVPFELGVVSRQMDRALGSRFTHIVSEARRVGEAASAVEAADLAGFGELLNASHESLKHDYEVSTPKLDALVARAIGAGAAGARLTGAGLGGAIVAVTHGSELDRLVDALADYDPFVAVAADGAESWTLSTP